MGKSVHEHYCNLNEKEMKHRQEMLVFHSHRNHLWQLNIRVPWKVIGGLTKNECLKMEEIAIETLLKMEEIV